MRIPTLLLRRKTAAEGRLSLFIRLQYIARTMLRSRRQMKRYDRRLGIRHNRDTRALTVLNDIRNCIWFAF